MDNSLTHRLMRSIKSWEDQPNGYRTVPQNEFRFIAPDKFRSMPEFPKSRTRQYTDFEIIESDAAIILGDSEIPDHDSEMFEMAARLAVRDDIKTLIIAGDFIALDSFSSWKRTTGTHYSFSEELEPAIQTLKAFLQIFSDVILISGNHECRIARMTDGQIILGYFLDGLDVRFSEYGYCVLISGNERFMIAHPDKSSKSTPQKLANLNAMHIIMAHSHRQSMSMSDSGLHYVVETGHCRDVSRTAYKSLRVNTFAEWQPGFVVVYDGVPFLVNRQNQRFIRRV